MNFFVSDDIVAAIQNADCTIVEAMAGLATVAAQGFAMMPERYRDEALRRWVQLIRDAIPELEAAMQAASRPRAH
jgi:acyl-CoA reductase-like NAD-dependent aldehyde dehydrogenase